MKRRFIVGLASIIIMSVAAYLYAGRFGSTPLFRDAAGAVMQDSVAEMERVNLGGVEQSITIRGRDAKAPILIWLHGGPGQDKPGCGAAIMLSSRTTLSSFIGRSAGLGDFTILQFLSDQLRCRTLLPISINSLVC